MTAAEWDTIAIVGVGLIGGSIGRSVKRQGLCRHVIGIGRRLESLARALEYDAVDEITVDLEKGVSKADLIIVCSPVETIADLVERIARACPKSAIITDAGSTKRAVVDEVAARHTADEPIFIGSHPLAGSEKGGVEHARDDLFGGRTVVVTPSETTPADAVARLQAFWCGLGANVVRMTPTQHDEAVAATSHLPHVVAAALAAATPEEYLPLVATGWLDTTRVASGDVELWRQILAQNRGSVLQCMQQFAKVLNSFIAAMQQQDEAAVTELLASGKQRRDALAD